MTEPSRRLRETGLRATRPRLAVLAALEELGGHRTADELLEALRGRGGPLPRSTLYAVLAVLVDRGLVMIADVGPGRAMFEAAEDWHHHLVCRLCGRIVDVPCLGGDRLCLTPELPGAEVDEAQVIFRGLCPECAAA